jgi:two-component system, OmpR family, alkaline phosphatase synthesis response regulator PhoP
MTTVLVIEDDSQIRKVVEAYLQQAGYHVLTAADGPTGLALARSARLEITRQLRTSSDPALASLYIIMLTARVEEADRVVGLELGADDYVTKPFSPRELVARVRSALRRLEGMGESYQAQVLMAGELRLDPTYRTVTLAETALDVTAVEFDLLHHFMRHPGRPFTRAELLDITQPDALGETAAYERTIDVHVKNLRHKLGDAGRHSRFIETVHGIGYRFLTR